MNSTVRWISAFIVWLLLCLSTPAIAQRGESCDAKPRWLLVTVLELDYYTPSKSKDGSGLRKHEAASGKIPNGRLQMIDRCGNGIIQMSDNNGIGPGEGKPGKAIIEHSLYSEGGEITTLVRYFVKESMADLCRAMKDCADATSSRP